MPRYPATTFLNASQNETVDKAAAKLKISRYKLLREALLAYCKACLEDGEEENERENGKNDSGTEERRQRSLAVSY